jgi:hypothetical protein
MGNANVTEAILAVMRQVGYVQKEHTAGLNYSYAGEAALIRAIRPAMVQEGLIAHVLDLTKEVGTVMIGKDGGRPMSRAIVLATVRFLHAPSGTHLDVQAAGEGMDTGDKALNKAMTGALKYALRQTFLIETGDDPDKERPENKPTKAKPAEHKVGPTEFWAAVKAAGLDKPTADNILAECEKDWAQATKAVEGMSPP